MAVASCHPMLSQTLQDFAWYGLETFDRLLMIPPIRMYQIQARTSLIVYNAAITACQSGQRWRFAFRPVPQGHHVAPVFEPNDKWLAEIIRIATCKLRSENSGLRVHFDRISFESLKGTRAMADIRNATWLKVLLFRIYAQYNGINTFFVYAHQTHTVSHAGTWIMLKALHSHVIHSYSPWFRMFLECLSQFTAFTW